MKDISFGNWKVFLVLFGVSILGIIFMMPYVLMLQADLLAQVPLPLSLVTDLSIVLCCCSVRFVVCQQNSPAASLLQDWAEGKNVKIGLKSIIGISCGLGILAAILIFVGDLIFQSVDCLM